MRTTISISICLSFIACQEQNKQSNIDTGNETDTTFSYSVETAPEEEHINSFDTSMNTIDAYIKEKLSQAAENNQQENMQVSPFPVDGDCIYGGIIEGELTLDTPNPYIVVDLFDDTDHHIDEIETTFSAMSNGQYTSPTHHFENDNFEFIVHKNYVDFSEGSFAQSTKNGQNILEAHLMDEEIELVLHKEYIDLEIDVMVVPNGQGKLRGDWFICQQ
jgi:hypothetical protein